MAAYRAGPPGVIYIIEPHPRHRTELMSMAEFGQRRAVGFASVEDFVASYREGGTACIVLDVTDSADGVARLRHDLAARQIHLPVLCVMEGATVDAAVAAMKGGAVDFFRMPVDRELFIAGVDEALTQDHERREAQAVRERAAGRLATLTDRELDILRLVLQGLSSREIAERLGIATKTVEAHRGRINSKTSAHSMPELVRLAVAAGLVEESCRGHGLARGIRSAVPP